MTNVSHMMTPAAVMEEKQPRPFLPTPEVLHGFQSKNSGLAIEHKLEGVKNLIIDIEIDPVSRISVCCHPTSLLPLLNEFLIKSVSKMLSL